MRKILGLIIVVSLISIASFGQAKFENWPEMKAYHALLSQTYHPAEDGDLKPIRTRSFELLTDIKLVNASPMPQEFDNDKIRKTLKRLEKECDKLNAIVVRQEQSVTVMKQFNVVHNTFHEIVGLCGRNEKNEK